MDKNLKVAIILSATDKATAVLNKAFANAQKHAKNLEKIGKGFSEVGDKMLIAGGVSTAFFAKTVADAREAKMAQDKLILGFQTMGSSAAQAMKMVNFAGAQQFKWGVEDEDIMDVMGKLSTFKRAMTDQAIASGVFNRATQAAFDMQAKGFGDAMSNITQLGKALQNPALGSQALARAGAINKEDMPLIQYIQQTKGIPAAQKYILDAVEKQVKGSAEKMADPVKVLELQMHESSEAIGRALLPTVSKLATQFANSMPAIIAFIDKHQDLIMMVAKAGIGLLAFGAAMKAISFVFTGLSIATKIFGGSIKVVSFFVANGGRIAALAAKGYDALKFGLFALRYAVNFSVLPALKAAGTAVVEFGATLLASPITWYVAAALALGAAVYFIYKNWDTISAFFANLWGKVKVIFSAAWNWIKNMFLNYTPEGLVIKHWDKIAALFVGIWDRVKNVFLNAWNWIMNLGSKFYDAGKNIIKSVWDGMKAMASKPVEMIANITTKIRSYLPFSPAKAGALKDIHRVRLVETVAQAMKPGPMVNAMRYATGQTFNQLNQPVPAFAGGGANYHAPVNLTINLHGGATQQDADRIGSTVKQTMDKWWRDKQHNQSRTSFKS